LYVQVKGLGFLVTPDVRPASTTIRDALAAAVKDGPAAPADLKPSKDVESLQVWARSVVTAVSSVHGAREDTTAVHGCTRPCHYSVTQSTQFPYQQSSCGGTQA